MSRRRSRPQKPAAITRDELPPAPPASRPSPLSFRFAVPLACLFLVFAVFAAFGWTLGNGFVNFDDPIYVYENPHINNGITLNGLRWVWTSSHAGNWHPLTGMSHMLDAQIYGPNAWGHHLTSVLLHAAVSVLLFLGLWRMTGELWPSALVAAIFAVHPLRAESVAWISERKGLLSGLFFMLTLHAYVSYVRHPFSAIRYLSVVAMFAMALMSKPAVVTLPCVLLLLDYWPLGRIKAPAERTSPRSGVGSGSGFSGQARVFGRLALEKVPLLLVAAVASTATVWAQSKGKCIVPLESIPLEPRIANAATSYIAYIGNFFYPVGLCAYYPHPLGKASMADGTVLAAILAIGLMTTAAISAYRRLPYLFVGWFWYVGMMVPMIGVFQVGMHARTDRYTYLPLIGLCIAMVWGIARVCAGLARRRLVLGAFSGVVLVQLMVCTWYQTTFWFNTLGLWARALECTKGNAMAHTNLAVGLFDWGDVDWAIEQCQEALKISPRFPEALNNLGTAYAKKSRDDLAIEYFQKAIEIDPNSPQPHYSLGLALARRSQLDEAIRHYRAAIALEPERAGCHYELGLALNQQGNAAEGISELRTAIQMSPYEPDAMDSLAWILATNPDSAIRNGAEAIEWAKRAIQLSGGKNPNYRVTLAAAYGETGHFNDAAAIVDEVLSGATRGAKVSDVEALKRQLECYRAGKPYRTSGERNVDHNKENSPVG
jgi:protein O-mannosyl-transferase